MASSRISSFRVGHEGAADGQHLLFAAGQLIAPVVETPGQRRKEAEDRPQVPQPFAAGGRACRGDQLFADRQVGKDLAALGDQGQAQPCHGVGRQADQRATLENHGASAGRQQAHDRAQGRGFAHAVASHQGDDLAGADFEVDPEEHLAGAVARFELLNFQHQPHSPR